MAETTLPAESAEDRALDALVASSSAAVGSSRAVRPMASSASPAVDSDGGTGDEYSGSTAPKPCTSASTALSEATRSARTSTLDGAVATAVPAGLSLGTAVNVSGAPPTVRPRADELAMPRADAITSTIDWR